MRGLKKTVVLLLLTATAVAGGCGGGYSDGQYPTGTQHTERVHVYDYADMLRAQQEAEHLRYMRDRQMIKDWDRTLDSFTGTGHKTQSMIGRMAEIQKRRSNR